MAGVSRQTIGAVESGQTALSITVALRLAKGLGCRVEDLFWLAEEATQIMAMPAQGTPQGSPLRVSLAQVGGRWVAHPLVGADAFRMELIPADGEVYASGDPSGDTALSPAQGQGDAAAKGQDPVAVTLLDDAANLLNTVVVAGCAPALSLWAKAAERWHPGLRVHLTFANSQDALQRLLLGEVHIAGMHLFCPHTQSFNLPFVRQALADQSIDQAAVIVNLGVWQEGLLVAPGNPKGIQGVADLGREDVVLINREPGAGSRHVLDQAMAEVGLSWLGTGPVAYSHQAVAEAILTGQADVGVSAASVAETFQLGFIPLRSSHYDLVTLKPYIEEPPVQQLLATLGHRRVLSQLEHLGGYDTQLTGEVIATINPQG